jgi:hypothetical protein
MYNERAKGRFKASLARLALYDRYERISTIPSNNQNESMIKIEIHQL